MTDRVFLFTYEWSLRAYYALALSVMRAVGIIAEITGKRSTKLGLRPHKEDLHDIGSFWVARVTVAVST